jgi:chromosome segregation ATPase
VILHTFLFLFILLVGRRKSVAISREKRGVAFSDSLQYLNDSEENLRLDLTKIQQELDSERAVDTATEILAEEKLSGTKNALEFQVNELQENLEVVQHQNESIKQELYSEPSAHSETKSPLELCQNQLEEGRNRHLLELSKVLNTDKIRFLLLN